MGLNVQLAKLKDEDKEQFILDNQRAFKYGAVEEFGIRDEHYEEDGEIISRKTIENSIQEGIAYRIQLDDKNVGGIVVNINDDHGDLELLFVNPECHSKGIGYEAWCKIEKMYSNIKVWETYTPYFETRNIHFYVNRCGFHIVEFFNEKHPGGNNNDPEHDLTGMFRFEKIMKNNK